MKKPIFAVIDTSVLISAFMSPTDKSASFWILQNYLASKPFVWVISQPLYAEYMQKLAIKFPEIQKRAAKKGVKFDTTDVDEVMAYLVENCAWMEMPPVIQGITSDANDDHIGTLAVGLGVDYLVTLDNDFELMKKGRYTVEVVRPYDFMQAVRLAS